MIKKIAKQNTKERSSKNDIKQEQKKVLKKRKPKLTSKNISSKSKEKKTSELPRKNKKEIVLKRSSGKIEKFDTDRLAQTVSRGGVSYPVARNIAKSTTRKIKKSIKNTSTQTKKKIQPSSKNTQKLKFKTKKDRERIIITADQVKNLVMDELIERNQQAPNQSFSEMNTNLIEEKSLNDKEPVIDKVAANKNKILFDPSKQKGRS